MQSYPTPGSGAYMSVPHHQQPVPLLDPPENAQGTSSSYAYMHNAPEQRVSMAGTDKYNDEPVVDESAIFDQGDSTRNSGSMYTRLGLPHRRGIWQPEDLRAFENQSTLMKIVRIFLFIIVFGILLTICILILLFIFLRPPNIGLDNISPQPENLSINGNTFQFDANISVVVSNPNSVSADIKNISALAYDDSVRTTSIGSCSKVNQKILANDNTTVELPCMINYDLSKDPNLSIIKNVANRCFNTNEDLKIALQVHLDVQLFSFTVPINVNPTVSMKCPVSKQQVEDIIGKDNIGSLGINLGQRSLDDKAGASISHALRRLISYPMDADIDGARDIL
ncbi:hypothetical protein Malapachy_1731 [Malassezia pachydermatis]|uniref:Late embryogenesis abundant protein LEA-2 subgroup domain-containing protein n=1 Tax=Malassezia pachydermatis TaxID=77020 RepID=A0A0M8MUG1_9BASI|nr:hypothetical protein Malapachy_1731 [Malassezia pachydermatis]KOS13831.1 hypothetical protein Malapachy_1731 [Malassezia pachydermatis]